MSSQQCQFPSEKFPKTMEFANEPKLRASVTSPPVANTPSIPTSTSNQGSLPPTLTCNDDVPYSGGDGDDDYLDSFPPGYRFCPKDSELVVEYLAKKVMNKPLPRNRIADVKLYCHNPETLTAQYRKCGEKEWYFFTSRDRKYPKGSRPRRSAGNGYWKATGADKFIMHMNKIVGYKKALVFYLGNPPKGIKTNWIMHEYRAEGAPLSKSTDANNSMKLDDWVLCRLHKKPNNNKTRAKDEQQHDANISALADTTPKEANIPTPSIMNPAARAATAHANLAPACASANIPIPSAMNPAACASATAHMNPPSAFVFANMNHAPAPINMIPAPAPTNMDVTAGYGCYYSNHPGYYPNNPCEIVNYPVPETNNFWNCEADTIYQKPLSPESALISQVLNGPQDHDAWDASFLSYMDYIDDNAGSINAASWD